MRRKHRLVVEVTFFEPVTEKEACRRIDMYTRDSDYPPEVQVIRPAKNFERVLAKEIAKR